MDVDKVSEAIRFAEAQEIAPRFGRLRQGEVKEKSPGELVTEADRACELLLTSTLRDIADVPVVGEEAAAADPGLLTLIDASPAVWLVDPLDGTANFVGGSLDYAVMVAFVERGVTTRSWIWRPATAEMMFSELRAGAYVNDDRVSIAHCDRPIAGLTGTVKVRFLPAEVQAMVTANLARFAGHEPGPNCAGVEYPRLVEGVVDFILYWRTLPWDHAPGVLFAQEAGFQAQRPDGAPYRCGS